MFNKLPDIRQEEVVLFHRDQFMPSHWIVLQVPTKNKTNPSNTYRIDLQNADDRAWFKLIPLERKINDLLGLYGHVAYFPQDKELVPIEDKTIQNLTLSQLLFRGAEQTKTAEKSRWDRVNSRFRRILRPLMRWRNVQATTH